MILSEKHEIIDILGFSSTLRGTFQSQPKGTPRGGGNTWNFMNLMKFQGISGSRRPCLFGIRESSKLHPAGPPAEHPVIPMNYRGAPRGARSAPRGGAGSGIINRSRGSGLQPFFKNMKFHEMHEIPGIHHQYQ